MRNGDTNNPGFALKEELIEYAEELGIEFKKSKVLKIDLINMIIDVAKPEDIAERFNIGIASRNWKNKFNLSTSELRKLAGKGVLNKTGQIIIDGREGKYTSNLYDIVQFYAFPEEELKGYLKK